jgi:hypothetical protein
VALHSGEAGVGRWMDAPEALDTILTRQSLKFQHSRCGFGSQLDMMRRMDPAHATRFAVTELRLRSTVDKVLLAIGLGGAILAPLPTILLAPHYRMLTQQVGIEMALVTRVALAWHPYAWALLPPLVLAAWWWWPQRPRRALVACLIGVVGAATGMSLALAAWVWPIFRVGSLVG